MTSQSRTDLQSNIDAKIASGVAASVSAQDVREVATDLSDSSFNLTTNDTDDITEGDNKFATAAQLTKLDGVEDNATADQTNAEIETAYNAQVAVVTQAEAEAGTSTDVKRFTPERVRQAIAALSSGGGSSAIKIYNTVVSETTSITDLVSHTIPANTLGLTGQCRIKCQGYLYNGSGSTTNATVYIAWGGSTIFFDTTTTFASDTSDPYGLELDLIISNINDVDKQYIQGRFELSNNTDANQGRGDLTTDDTKIQCVWGGETLAGSPLRDQFVYADTTSDQTIQIQVAPSLSNANYQWVAAVTTIEYL